jgi:hypothetical protein
MNNKSIICIEGYSASLRRKKEDTIYNVIEKCFDGHIVRIDSAKWNAIDTIIETIKKSLHKQIMIIGKSMGGAKLYTALQKEHNCLELFEKVNILFVDPHGLPREKWFKHMTYGKYKPLYIPNKWVDENISYTNIYQHNKYPKGAQLTGYLDEEWRVSDKKINHFNIIHHKFIKEKVEEFKNQK